jgi:membrane protease YdiL (CAAX protease family)
MFEWKMFLALVALCIPGILVTVPGTLKRLARLGEDRLPPGKEMPPMPVLVVASTVQSLVVLAIPAAIGTTLAHQVGLRAPVFEALLDGAPLRPALQPQVLPTLVIGIAGALLFVATYYRLFRPWLDAETRERWDALRNGLGIWARLLYGGIAEEVLTRWGLMSLLVWLGALAFGKPSPAVVWAAIVVSGVLFGLGHAPSYLAAGCHKTPAFFSAMIALNLWASLIFGWLFWRYGLLAAMMAHMLFHLVWWPFDLRVSRSTAKMAMPELHERQSR